MRVADFFAVMFGSIITLAIIAVLVSRNATTASLIQAASSGLSNILGTVVSPVTKQTTSVGVTANMMNNSLTGGANAAGVTAPVVPGQ